MILYVYLNSYDDDAEESVLTVCSPRLRDGVLLLTMRSSIISHLTVNSGALKSRILAFRCIAEAFTDMIPICRCIVYNEKRLNMEELPFLAILCANELFR